MNIAIYSENGIRGRIPNGFSNARVEFCWANCLDADMIPLRECMNTGYDIAIFILPKKTRNFDTTILKYKEKFPRSKVGVMQEGPIDYFYEFLPTEQFRFLDILGNVDFLLVHNLADKIYLQNIYPKQNIHVFKTLYDSTLIPKFVTNRAGIILSGNMSKWYGGTFPLYILRQISNQPIYMIKSGRMSDDEIQFVESNSIIVLPWQMWSQWIQTLNNFKIGINLMETRAAGTFSLNCASLGIPCIGFEDLDTQKSLHDPDLCLDKRNYDDFLYQLTILLNDDTYDNLVPNAEFANINNSIENNRDNFKHLMEQIHDR